MPAKPAACTAADLRCNAFADPIGIDTTAPRLQWRMIDARRGARQSAYQVQVAAGEGAFEDRPAWDSGKVDSDRCLNVRYAGTPLTPATRYRWRVRLWDADGIEGDWSEEATFETGLFDRDRWQADWIAAPNLGGPFFSPPCPHVRKGFRLDAPVAFARLRITAIGVYEARINGQPVGDYVFAPGWTDYRKRVQVQTYDVTDLLREGDNALGAILGDGWACGHVAWHSRELYAERPMLLARLEVTHADGSTSAVTTDESWRWAYGPILGSDMLQGEQYDARKELPGWDGPGLDESAWAPVELCDEPSAALWPTLSPPVRRQEELAPVEVTTQGQPWAPRKWLFDLGQNMVGRLRIGLKGPRGASVILRHGEMLDADGNLYTENLRTARATDVYTLRGDPDGETWEPRFTFHGFRYAQVESRDGIEPLTHESVTGVVLQSDTPPTGRFECSDPLINQLQHNITWGQKGNFLEVPTDCPQRDERLGWTGDAQVFVRTACFNMDVAPFFHKWQRDLADAQHDDGGIPPVVPVPGEHNDGGPAWADAAVICPWTIYLCYGDESILRDAWPTMTRFVDRLERLSKDHIRAHPEVDPWGGFGDWLSMGAETPKDLIGTAFFAYSARLTAKTARVLGKDDDARRYDRLADDVTDAFRRRFVTPEGLLAAKTQTAYVLALHFDLLESDEQKARAIDQLVRDIHARGMHLSTGFVGSPYLPHVLSRAGRTDTAYALLHQKTWPSWLYAVTQGATTIWERWDGWTHDKGFQSAGMNSFNHYAYGAIGDWLYSTVAGLDLDPDRPGYKHALIHPTPGGGLTRASARLDSALGQVASAWRLAGDGLEMSVAIPPNASATVRFPTGTARNVRESGKPLDEADGISDVRIEDGAVLAELVAGEYAFEVDEPIVIQAE